MAAGGIVINGVFCNIPGTYGEILFIQAANPGAFARVLGVIGNYPYCPYGVAVEVTNGSDLLALNPNDPTLQLTAQAIYEASADDRITASPASVVVMNVAPNTLAYINLVDSLGNPSVLIQANVYGALGNQTVVSLTIDGSEYTVATSRGGTSETFTAEALELFDLQYTPTTAATTIAAGSDGDSLPQATINVASTTGFPASGTIRVVTSAGAEIVTYTGVTSTTFTGCSGGAGTMSTGGVVNTNFWATATAGVRPYTTIAVGSNGAVLPQATINVASTAALAPAGVALIETTEGTEEIAYTAKTATTLIGCTGGTGTLATGNDVAPFGGDEFYTNVSRATLELGTFAPACPWDGVVLLTPSGAPSTETYTAVVTGIDAATGVSTTDTVTWLNGVATAKTTAKSFSTLTSIVFSTDGNDTPTFTVAGDIERANAAEYPTAGSIATALSATRYSAAGLVVTAVNDLADQTNLDSMDPLPPTSLATAHTFTSISQAIVQALQPSVLVVAEAVPGGGAPVALSATNMAGGSQSVPDNSTWQVGYDALRNVYLTAVWPNTTSTSIIGLQRTHLQYMSGPGRNPRQGFAGLASMTTLTAAKAATAGINSRLEEVYVDDIRRGNPQTGVLQWNDPRWTALQFASMSCGTQRSLTYTTPAGDDFRRSPTIPGTEVSNNPAIAAGLCILGRPVNGSSPIITRLLREVTSIRTTSDPNRTDGLAVRSENELLNAAFAFFVDTVGEPTTVPVEVLQSSWRGFLQASIGAGIIAGATISQATVRRTGNVNIFAAPVQFRKGMEFQVFQITAAPDPQTGTPVFQLAA